MTAALRHVLIGSLGAVFIAWAGPTLAQEVPGVCDYGDPAHSEVQCDELILAQTLEFYDLASAERLAEEKAHGLRIFWGGSYASPSYLVLSAWRGPGEPPRITVFGNDDEEQWSFSEIASGKTFIDMMEAGSIFDAELVPPSLKNGTVVICSHSTRVLAEMIELDGTIRRREGNSCFASPAWEFSEDVVEIAATSLVRCTGLERQFLEGRGVLAICNDLRGDWAAASEVVNLLADDRFYIPGRRFPYEEQRIEWRDSVMTWIDGTEVRGAEAIARFIEENVYLMDWRYFTGNPPDEVVGRGLAETLVEHEADRDTYPLYAFEATWRREGSDPFKITELSVNPEPALTRERYRGCC